MRRRRHDSSDSSGEGEDDKNTQAGGGKGGFGGLMGNVPPLPRGFIQSGEDLSLLEAMTVIEENVADAIQECIKEVKDELSIWNEIINCEIHDDPLFEKMTLAFREFTDMLSSLSFAVQSFIAGLDSMHAGMEQLSDTLFNGIQQSKLLREFHEPEDIKYLTSQVVRYKESTSLITNENAPKSSVTKLKVDLKFNVIKPLKEFVSWSSRMKSQLGYRQRMLAEYELSTKEVSNLLSRSIRSEDIRLTSARQLLVSMTQKFASVDRHCYMWLTVLEDFRVDIWDSVTQTLKYLLHEYYKTGTLAWNGSLPSEVIFRPLVEMTPKMIKPLVEDEEKILKAEELDELRANIAGMTVRDMPDICYYPHISDGTSPNDVVVGTTARRIKSNPAESSTAKARSTSIIIDPLALELLKAQGIDGLEAEEGLIRCNNDPHSAMEGILYGWQDENESELEEADLLEEKCREGRRTPKSLKWLDKIDKLIEERTKIDDAQQVSSTAMIEKKKKKKREHRNDNSSDGPAYTGSISSSDQEPLRLDVDINKIFGSVKGTAELILGGGAVTSIAPDDTWSNGVPAGESWSNLVEAHQFEDTQSEESGAGHIQRN